MPVDSADALIGSLRGAVAQIEQGHSPEVNTRKARSPEFIKAKKQALNMLSVRDHSSSELRAKLLAREHSEVVVAELVSALESAGLLNDREFAHAYVQNHRQRRQLSKAALKRELGKKGIAQENIAQAISDVTDEHELAFGVALKKAQTTVGLPREKRERRILGMLARRGFSSGITLDVTRRALDEA